MKFFFTDNYVLPLPEGHRFPMSKYRLLRQRLLDTGLAAESEIELPPEATDDDILRAHDADYLQRVQYGLLTEGEIRRIGFPWSPEMVIRVLLVRSHDGRRPRRTDRRRRRQPGRRHAPRLPRRWRGLLRLQRRRHRRTSDASGRPHPACGRHRLRRSPGQRHGIDPRGDDTIFTFSIHGANNFPLRKEQSDLDVELPDGTEDATYLDALAHGLDVALSHADADLAIYVSGADPFRDDRFGRLKLTKEGLSRRDEMVFKLALQERGLPVAVTMAGGYSRNVADTVDIHYETLRQARTILERPAYL